MTITIVMIALMMCLSIGYAYFMNAGRKRSLGDYNADNQYHRAMEILQEMMSGHLDSIKKHMEDRPVDAVTECMHITNLNKQTASAALTVAKTAAWAAIGVKTRYRTADHACYLVLSGEELHYLFFEEEALKEHLIFDKYRLIHAKLEQISGTDKITRMSSALGRKSQKVVMDVDGKKMEILFYDRISRLPEGPLSFTTKDAFKISVDFEIMGTYFKQELGKKYAQLAVTII